jgi:hypothetical protein
LSATLEQIYYEQESIIEEANEQIIIEDNGVDSSDSSEESSDKLECSVRSGRIGRGKNTVS